MEQRTIIIIGLNNVTLSGFTHIMNHINYNNNSPSGLINKSQMDKNIIKSKLIVV